MERGEGQTLAVACVSRVTFREGEACLGATAQVRDECAKVRAVETCRPYSLGPASLPQIQVEK
jgi:hypothetical protein